MVYAARETSTAVHSDTADSVSWDTRVRDIKVIRTTGCSVLQDKVTDSIGTVSGVSQDKVFHRTPTRGTPNDRVI